MPLNLLLKFKKRPTDFRIKQLLQDYKHYNGIYIQTKDPVKKRKIARTGYAVQLQMVNFGLKLHKPSKWNSPSQWKHLVGLMRRKGILKK